MACRMAAAANRLSSSTLKPAAWSFTIFLDVELVSFGAVGYVFFRTENATVVQRIGLQALASGILQLDKRDSTAAQATQTILTDTNLPQRGRMMVALLSDGTTLTGYVIRRGEVYTKTTLALGTMSLAPESMTFGAIFGGGGSDGICRWYGALGYDAQLTEQEILNQMAAGLTRPLVPGPLFWMPMKTAGNAHRNYASLTDMTVSGTIDTAVDVPWVNRPGLDYAALIGGPVWSPALDQQPRILPLRPMPGPDQLPPVSAPAAPALAPPDQPRVLPAVRIVAPWSWDIAPPLAAPAVVPPPTEAPRALPARQVIRALPADLPPPQTGVFSGTGFPQFDPAIRARLVPPPLPFDAPPPIAAPPAPPPPAIPAPVVATQPLRTFTQPQPPPPLQQPAPPAPFVVRAFRAIFHPHAPMPMPAQVFPPPPPPPEAPRAIQAIRRIWRLILEVGWPQTVGPVNTQEVCPPLVAVVDSLDQTVRVDVLVNSVVVDSLENTIKWC